MTFSSQLLKTHAKSLPRATQQRLAAARLWIGVVLFALAVGCNSPLEMERSLADAGFKLYPADNPKHVLWIDSLPEDRITPVQRDGTTYYTYPDRKKHALYVGREREYQQYRRLRMEKQRAAEQLGSPQIYNASDSGPWVW